MRRSALDAGDKRIAQIERELAGVDGETRQAQRRGRDRRSAHQGRRRLAARPGRHEGRSGPRPRRLRARARRFPPAARCRARSARCIRHCVQLYDAMISTDATKDRVRNIDCDPKQARKLPPCCSVSTPASRPSTELRRRRQGARDRRRRSRFCSFGRKCLQDFGPAEQGKLGHGGEAASIDLNRDDKAHNFVVYLNAFQDGNRLAYLALAIAIGIDSLIFMTGLFGANAVRSPLSDVPSMKARNSQELNAMIETALLPDVFKKARLVRSRCIRSRTSTASRTRCVSTSSIPRRPSQVRDVLNAGVDHRRGAPPGRRTGAISCARSCSSS